jgi:hypothetical protein
VKGAGQYVLGYSDLPGFRTALIDFVTSFEKGQGASAESK